MRKKLTGLIGLAGAVAFTTVFFASGLADTSEFEYVGVKKCKMCHKSEKSGAQYVIWEKNMHARAYETLASEKSLEVAKAMGIEDPQKSEKCLKCHSTAFLVPEDKRAAGVVLEDGVTCESCHGPGSGYKKKSIMTAIHNGEEKGEKYGMTTITVETCTKCHNEESPTYDESNPFDFEERSKKIAHPVPKT